MLSSEKKKRGSSVVGLFVSAPWHPGVQVARKAAAVEKMNEKLLLTAGAYMEINIWLTYGLYMVDIWLIYC